MFITRQFKGLLSCEQSRFAFLLPENHKGNLQSSLLFYNLSDSFNTFLIISFQIRIILSLTYINKLTCTSHYNYFNLTIRLP